MAGQKSERWLVPAIVGALLVTAFAFRVMRLSSVPGINGDEGWWGVQATHWVNGEPYEATTTSGNPIDMAFLVPLGLLHRVAGPSFAVLRLLPVLANLIALALGLVLARRLYGGATAWIYTVALAIAPTSIVHSRFCQDPSQSVLWVSITMFLALLGFAEQRRWWAYQLGALLGFAMAFYTHPTNLFIAPFIPLPLVPVVARWLPATRRGRVIFAGAVTAAAVVLAAIALLVVWPAIKSHAGSSTLLDKPWLAAARARLFSAGAWFEYVRNYGRLFSGVTVIRYETMAHLTIALYGFGALAVFGAIAAGLALVVRRERRGLDVALVIAWAAMVLLYFLFAGPESIRPHVERWGLVLLPPAFLMAARATVGWLGRYRTATIAAATIIAVALCGSFYLSYFHEFATSGGRSHRTFITADTEPKQQALAMVLAERRGTGPILIVAQDWWQYWPIAYLALPDPTVRTAMKIPADEDPSLGAALADGNLYFVEFVGSPELAHAEDWIRARHLRQQIDAVHAADGRELFHVIAVSR